MNSTVLAIAYLITSLTEAGLTVSDVMRKVKETGIVPPEEWDKLDAALKDAGEFWK